MIHIFFFCLNIFDSSVLTGFDNLADLDPLGGQIGAVGGSHHSSTRETDAFPDVFSEPLKAEEGVERSSGGRKVYTNGCFK